MKFVSVLAGAAVASYEQEWQEFQAVQGLRNGEIPEAFKSNVDFVRAHNSKESTFQLSYTGPFAAFTTEEYQRLLGFRGNLHGDLPKVGSHEHSGKPAIDSMDWSSQGAVTPIKDQGQCGSCWAFSSTGSLEGQWQLATGNLVALSEQQLVDCVKNGCDGCNGGLMDSAFEFWQTKRVASEASYPYHARGSHCSSSFDTAIPEGAVTGYKDVFGEDLLLDAVSTQGPISVAIQANQRSFQMYKNGIITAGCGTSLDHGVLAVGFGTENGVDYWKVKNSWGASWGDSGYVRIKRGVNMCGIGGTGELGPSYPLVKAVPVPAPTPPPPTPPPATHYTEPLPTGSGGRYCPLVDEEVKDKGESLAVCAAPCSTDEDCPTDVPPGTSATPKCNMRYMKGLCALKCGKDSGCPDGAVCVKHLPNLVTGNCMYQWTDNSTIV